MSNARSAVDLFNRRQSMRVFSRPATSYDFDGDVVVRMSIMLAPSWLKIGRLGVAAADGCVGWWAES